MRVAVCRLFAVFVMQCGLVSAADEPVDYLRQVKPILAKRCYACHGALKQEAGLRVDTAESLRKGGDSGAAVELGDGLGSLLLDAVTGASGIRRMPPKDDGAPLSETEIALLRLWIDQGAIAPADEQPQADPRKHWAFQPVVRPAVPAAGGAQSDVALNPIDAFIATEYTKRGLTPTGHADRATLLRRVSLDLTGLPPTRDDLRAFLSDVSPHAYEQAVDRLLASPQYGERWARHWMDIWRYSDWYGRRAVPDVWNSAPQIWRWRDWIVQSLNADKGYDRMVAEMLAADEIAPEDDEAAVATGYLIRNWYALNSHQWMKDLVEHTGKAFLGLTFNCAHCHDHKYDPISQEDYFRFRAFFEPIQVRQDRWPGEPDPGPFQKYEYTVLRKIVPHGAVRIFDENLSAETFMYRMGDERDRIPDKPPIAPGAPAFLSQSAAAVAAPVAIPPRAQYPGLKPFIRDAETAERQTALVAARQTLPTAQQALVAALMQETAIEEERAAAIRVAPAGAAEPPPVDPRWLDRRNSAQAATRAARQAAELAEARLALAHARAESLAARIAADDARFLSKAVDADELARKASRAERRANLSALEEQRVAAAHALISSRTAADAATPGMAKDQALAAAQNAEKALGMATTAVDAAKQTLDTDSTTYTPLSPIYPAQSTGRRKALAEWIIRPDNPLTSRVAVNHIWARHFGRPLVDTVFDFGVNGKRPSHPELLDWLAAELMQPSAAAAAALDASGAAQWRMKHLHRLIVTSQTYRLASMSATPAPASDPDNRFLWKFPQRRAEAEVVRDALLSVSGQLDLTRGGTPADNGQETASRRRSIYFSIHPEDGGHPKFMELFDAPDPCDCYKRAESLIPQQALALVNSQLTIDLSRGLGAKLWESIPSGEEDARLATFVTAAYEQVLSRPPTEAELLRCRTFLLQQVALYQSAPAPAVAQAAQGWTISVTFLRPLPSSA